MQILMVDRRYIFYERYFIGIVLGKISRASKQSVAPQCIHQKTRFIGCALGMVGLIKKIAHSMKINNLLTWSRADDGAMERKNELMSHGCWRSPF